MAWFERLPIRWQLTLRWTMAFAVVLALANAAIYVGFERYASRELDAQARTLAATELASSTDAADVHIHGFPRESLGAGEYADKFAQLVDARGAVLAVSPGGPAAPVAGVDLLARAFAGEAPVIPVHVAGRAARLAIVAGEKDGVPYAIAVGVYTDRLDASLASLSWLLAVVWLVGLAATAALGYALASRALGPIDRITRHAAAIAQGDDERRLEAPSRDDEIGRMTRLINTMLDRLYGAIEAHRRFASDASHELRSPLTAMLGEIDVSLRRPRTAGEYRDTLETVRTRLHDLIELAENLILLSRVQEGRTDGSAPEVPLRRVLESSVARLERLAADRQVSLLLEPQTADIRVYGDERLLARVFDNLLANAVQYNHPGGAVVVRSAYEPLAPAAGSASTPVVVSIEDTGIGIPQHARERIFDRFYRVDASRSRRTGGVGLGLPIARVVAELYGGNVRVARSSPEGTVFEVRLPGRLRRELPEIDYAPSAERPADRASSSS
jgi:signal transduction histidine kinase